MNKHNKKWCLTETRVLPCFMQRKESTLLKVGLFSLLTLWVKWICPAPYVPLNIKCSHKISISNTVTIFFQTQ